MTLLDLALILVVDALFQMLPITWRPSTAKLPDL
jgi:hypothetical protein